MAKNKKTNPSFFKIIRNRLIAGLFVLLPVIITCIVIFWLYEKLNSSLIHPISNWLLESWYPAPAEPPTYIRNILAPIAALSLIGGILFIAGMFFNSRVHRFVNWFLNNVPGVNMVYSVVSNVFEAVQRSKFGADEFKRVVLVEFPHPGMKVPAFVTSETRDEATGEEILCVYVPTTPVPTSGYMLMVPESKVIQLDWDLQETLQAIVSGGITAPSVVRYHRAQDPPKLQPPNDTD